jgi:hypothetical protein
MVGGLVGLFLLTVLLLAVLTGQSASNTSSGGHGQVVDGVKCEGSEQLAYHIHQHLFILVDGNPQTIPAYVGIPGAPLLTRCIYWIHTHDATGVMHVESPLVALYTLGQFFDIWGQPLNSTKVAGYSVTSGQLVVYVDGHQYSGDPRNIPLGVHTQIVIEIGRPVAPPQFTFQAGL